MTTLMYSLFECNFLKIFSYLFIFFTVMTSFFWGLRRFWRGTFVLKENSFCFFNSACIPCSFLWHLGIVLVKCKALQVQGAESISPTPMCCQQANWVCKVCTWCWVWSNFVLVKCSRLEGWHTRSRDSVLTGKKASWSKASCCYR